MKKQIIAVTVLVGFSLLTAGDASEEKATKSPLKVYSGGISAGALLSLSDALQEKSEQFLKLSIVNTFSIRNNLDIFADIDWLAPGNNMGADVGFDVIFLQSDFRPFAGIGGGAHYIDRSGDFGENIGLSATIHAGLIVDLSENVAIRMRVPYHLFVNEYRDHAVGFECAFLFSSRLKKVKKLNYN